MEFKVTIKKRTQNEYIVLFMFLLPFFLGLLIDLIGLPSLVRYTIDIAWVFLLFTMVVKKVGGKIGPKNLLIWSIAFFLYTLVIYVPNYESAFYYLWGLRNNFRFYVFFFACIIYLNSKDIEKYLKWFDRIFYVNAVVVIIQYFVLQYEQDHLGGIFGTGKGCNGYINIFMVIVITKSILYFLHKKENTVSCVVKCLIALVIAALAELKFFYVEFALIVFLLVLITRFSLRKLFISIVSVVGLVVGIFLLIYLFPEFKETMTIEGMYESATSEQGYTSKEDLNRLTTFQMTTERFLKTTKERMFGLGLGNCDYAEGYDFLTTPFYNRYKDLHYVWFSTSFVLVEMGIIGLIFFIGFFVLLFVEAQFRKKNYPEKRLYCQMTQVLSVLCILSAIYNSSLRVEAAYMMYFVLAIPFVNDGKKKRVEIKDDKENYQKNCI